MLRFFTNQHLIPGCTLELEPSAARHVQVLRLQPGDAIMLFNGLGNQAVDKLEYGDHAAVIHAMGRASVSVVVGSFVKAQQDTVRKVHIALGMPANDRMDWLVEKATELGVSSIAPLMTERSVLRLQGERLIKKLAHWRGIAIAASEQCGRSQVPLIHAPVNLTAYLKELHAVPCEAAHVRLLSSLKAGAPALVEIAAGHTAFTLLSGPEGGLTSAEELAALAAGFTSISLGSRTLRAETAPLAALAFLQLL